MVEADPGGGRGGGPPDRGLARNRVRRQRDHRICFQLVALKLLHGHRGTTAIRLACFTFAAAWATTVVAGQLGSGLAAQCAFVFALVIFAIGATFLSPTFSAIANDISPDHLRGRYNSCGTLALTTGNLCGPLLAGLALTTSNGTPVFFALALIAIAATFGASRLARALPANTDMITNTTR
ncbi:hypothetical protein AYO39_01075 [Actinobacteria bacterium SCGC AG-212-D09]|nr:hypothetical protein AYO39_01075 [Actinobacteria bacterium SCGC AG-212-D09]